jgi:hypothetical protein
MVPAEIDQRPRDMIAPSGAAAAKQGFSHPHGYAEPFSKSILEFTR